MPDLNDSQREILAKIYRNTLYGSEISPAGWESSKSYYINDINKFLDSLGAAGYDVVVKKVKK